MVVVIFPALKSYFYIPITVLTDLYVLYILIYIIILGYAHNKQVRLIILQMERVTKELTKRGCLKHSHGSFLLQHRLGTNGK